MWKFVLGAHVNKSSFYCLKERLLLCVSNVYQMKKKAVQGPINTKLYIILTHFRNGLYLIRYNIYPHFLTI